LLFKLFSGFLFLFFNTCFAFAQNQTLLSPLNSTIRNLSLSYNPQGIIYWKCGELMTEELFTTYKAHSGLGTDDSMHLYASWVDSTIGLTHKNFRHYYKGIPVENSMYIEHSLEDTVYITMGRISEGLNLSDLPAKNEASALSFALDYFDAEEYFWENDTLEDLIKDDSLPNDTTWYPKGELVYAFMYADSTGYHHKLAWKFNISATIPPKSQTIYVDAINGDIIDSLALTKYDGTFDHVFLGSLTLDTKWVNTFFDNYHVTEANNSGHFIKAQDNSKKANLWKSKNLPSDDDDTWGNSHWSATTSLWNFTNVWDYFENTWKRKGTDGKGREIRIYSDLDDAQYDKSYDQFGYDVFKFKKPKTGIYQGALDFSGHEYVHAIINHGPNGDLQTNSEQGALAESFGDIFGTLAEMSINGAAIDWVVGGELETMFQRKLDDPNSRVPNFNGGGVSCGTLPTGYPSVYMGTNWYTGNCKGNKGEIHCNSTVQSFWFVLLTQGGTQLGITVSGVGVEKASKITWYSLANFIATGDNYLIAREKSIAAAIILYGQCSFEHIQTCKAWAAVGVGTVCDPCALNGSCDFQGLLPEAPSPATNIGEQLRNNIRIYPNPVASELKLEIDTKILASNINMITLEIVDMLGNVVQIVQINSPKHLNKIDVDSLTKGYYALRLKSNNSLVGIAKFLKL
jgi:bacillolysin